ncbi:MAG: polymer-forming cytoskeletal protein [Myxococcota bacterium]
MIREPEADLASQSEFPSATDALVPEGGLFEGQVAVAGPTRIEGTVRGTLRGPGALLIGPAGTVEGQVDCKEVIAQGRVIGPVRAEDRACLKAGAYFEGDLAAPVLEVHDEAVWLGQARVGKPARD